MSSISSIKPFTCIESSVHKSGGSDCKFAAATKSKLIAHMINLHSMTHLEAKEDVDQREFDLTIPEGMHGSKLKTFIFGLGNLKPPSMILRL